jgi:serine/threonine protein kinase
VLHAHLTEQEAEHFQQEAQTIATLVHPGIVRVFDFDVQEGAPFLVMDYAPNGTLRRRYPKGKPGPTPRDHRCGQAGSRCVAVCARAEIQYALGVVVYEWLCGERPFEGSVSEMIAQHLGVPPLSLRERTPTIPVEVERVVLRALAKDPKARFISVKDFASALKQASQRALASTGQQALEQSALSPAAAAGYDTVAVAPSQPDLPTETTPSADLPVGALEPTVYPGSSAQNGQDTP